MSGPPVKVPGRIAYRYIVRSYPPGEVHPIMSISIPVSRTFALEARREPSLVARRAAGIALWGLLTALSAQIALPIPGTPVPITLQTLAVTLAPFALGPWLGAGSMALYVGLGLIGLPVFAAASGGLTSGYLAGFIAAQPVMGLILGQRAAREPSLWRAAAAIIAGNIVIFVLGVAWLRIAMGGLTPGFSWEQAMAMGLVPFIPGSIVKIGLAMALARDVVLAARRLGG